MDPISLAAILSAVEMIAQLVEDTSNNKAVTTAVNAIEAWAPVIAKSAPQLWSRVTELMSILFGADDLTDDQITQLVNARAALKAARAATKAA